MYIMLSTVFNLLHCALNFFQNFIPIFENNVDPDQLASDEAS